MQSTFWKVYFFLHKKVIEFESGTIGIIEVMPVLHKINRGKSS
jgi:hypothetical protein